MKQILFLVAIYALIINQTRKNEPSQAPNDNRKYEGRTSARQYHVVKYRYFNEVVYLVSSAETKQRHLVFEDGTTMEVVDPFYEPLTRKPANSEYKSAVYFTKD